MKEVASAAPEREAAEAPGRQPLAGVGVGITRPAGQAAHLARLVEDAGGRAILFPVLEILDAGDMRPLHALIDRLDRFDLAIFISPTAVNKAMNLILARRPLPPRLRFAAVGHGSSRELKKFGVGEVLAPQERFDSEHLLALPELQPERITGKQVVIFRGEGGRELLGNELARRGAHIEYAECYRRGKPEASATPLLHCWARNELHALTVTSSESLHNLFELVGTLGQQWLKKTPMFVPHERIAAVARQLGLERVFVTPPGDEGLLQGLLAWRREGGEKNHER